MTIKRRCRVFRKMWLPPAAIVLCGIVLPQFGPGKAAAQMSAPPVVPAPPPASSPPGLDPSDPFAAPPWLPAPPPAMAAPEDLDPAHSPASGIRQAADGRALTKEQQEAAAVLKKYLGVKQLQRTPGQALRAKAELALPKEPSSKPDQARPADDSAKVKEFYVRVVTGDWKAVKDHLSKLPKEAGPAVYSYLLVLLVKGKQTFVLPDEILALADASPGELDEPQLALLGQLLARSRIRLGTPKAMLAGLQRGTERLGGRDPKRRLAAARLLLAAGMVEQAVSYLPPLAQVYKTKDPAVMNLHAACRQALAARTPGDEGFRQAWELTQMVLDTPQLAEKRRTEAIRRSVALIPLIPEETVSAWARKRLHERPDLGLLVLAEAAQRVEQSFFQKAIEPRLGALAAQHRLVTGLLSADKKENRRWADAVRMTTLGWINEAAYTLGENVDVVSVASGGEELPVDSPGVAAHGRALQAANRGGNEIPSLPAKGLFPFSPNEDWCRVLDPDMARQVRRLAGKIAAETGDRSGTFAAIGGIADRDPKLAKELADQFLAAWAVRLSEGPSSSRRTIYATHSFGGYSPPAMYPSHYPYGMVPGVYMPHGYGYSSGSVPLIRARQVRNLAELSELLSALKALNAPPSECVVVAALGACHSPAEVYREEDLRRVFGKLDALQTNTILQLVADVRVKLARQWRRPELQEQLGTQRTDKDQVAELIRGYKLASRLLERAVSREPRRAAPVLLQATVWFDLAEFLYGQKADLKTYASTRDRAFGGYRKAAALYAEQLAGRPSRKPSIQVFRQWFNSALGASDLAFLTRQDRPDLDEIARVSAAIDGLKGAAADAHLAMFGAAVVGSMNQLPPHLKPHYLRQALRILGDHPAAEPARRRLQFYEDLLGEVQLDLAVDGNAEVGHNQPFGAFLTIRYTNALGRESGGFCYLLQKMYSQTSRREIDYPKEIEQSLNDKLGQTFEVQMVRFRDPKVVSRGFGRRDWRETPLAYVVLRAKTPAVDRIPAVPVDLEFNDGFGVVLLPVASPVLLIDARARRPALRPVAELKIRQVLDDRGLAAGKAQLEVVATGRGLVPGLDRLLLLDEKSLPGFRVGKVQDQGLELKSFDEGGDQLRPLCERCWLVELALAGDAPTEEFVFPKPVDEATTMIYQRYGDADLVDAAPTVPLQARPFSPRRWLPLLGALAGAILAAAAGALIYRRVRRRRLASVCPSSYRCPAPLTPFTLLELLRRIHNDQSLCFVDGDRHALGETIADLERQFFQRRAEPAGPVDLAAIADRWLAVATNVRKRKRRLCNPRAA